jgi:hypothetical protein
MNSVQFRPRGLVYLASFLVVVGALLALDKGSGPVTHVWPWLVLCAWTIASVAIIVRLWRHRHSPDDLKKAQLGIYPLLPRKMQKWMLGED